MNPSNENTKPSKRSKIAVDASGYDEAARANGLDASSPSFVPFQNRNELTMYFGKRQVPLRSDSPALPSSTPRSYGSFRTIQARKSRILHSKMTPSPSNPSSTSIRSSHRSQGFPARVPLSSGSPRVAASGGRSASVDGRVLSSMARTESFESPVAASRWPSANTETPPLLVMPPGGNAAGGMCCSGLVGAAAACSPGFCCRGLFGADPAPCSLGLPILVESTPPSEVDPLVADFTGGDRDSSQASNSPIDFSKLLDVFGHGNEHGVPITPVPAFANDSPAPSLSPSLWQPRLPYPLWDFDWDGRQTPDAGSPTLGKTRHIILVRHGQYNQGAAPAQQVLTKRGRWQAKLTGKRLEAMSSQLVKKHGRGIEVVRVSMMPRALQTANIIVAQLTGVEEVNPDNLLNEARPAKVVPSYSGWSDASIDASPEAAFRKYMYRAGHDANEYEVIVGHANVIRYFFCRALQLPPEAWLRIDMPHCSLTQIKIQQDGRCICQGLSDCGHLSPSDTTFG